MRNVRVHKKASARNKCHGVNMYTYVAWRQCDAMSFTYVAIFSVCCQILASADSQFQQLKEWPTPKQHAVSLYIYVAFESFFLFS